MHIVLPIHAFFSVSLRACVCRCPAKPKLIFFFVQSYIMHCNLLKVIWLLCTTFALCCLKITLCDIKTLFITMYNSTVFTI